VDRTYEHQGVRFVWDAAKERSNLAKHGISFEAAASVFFDPFIRMVDAGAHVETRDAVIGFDQAQRLLLVIHVERDDQATRIISARRATNQERCIYAP
jgi:uncharacterized protein